MELTNTQAEARAPGCFGAASVYSMDSTVCQECAAFQSCGEASTQTLENIRSVIDVSDIMARHIKARQKAQARTENNRQAGILNVPQPAPLPARVERKTPLSRVVFEISADHQFCIARIASSKTREYAIVLCKQNRIEPARVELGQGLNPFAESGPAFLRVACDMLLSGGFTRGTLKARLMADLAWKDNTAASHVAITCGLLLAFNIVQETKGVLALMPAAA